MVKKIAAIGFIYACTALAWLILGSTVLYRTNVQDSKLKDAVGELWGSVQTQKAPSLYYEAEREVTEKRIESGKTIEEIHTETVLEHLPLESSKIDVDLSLLHRRKGLLWYATYSVRFSGCYTVSNDASQTREIYFKFVFPTQGAIYDDFRITVDGEELDDIEISSGQIAEAIVVPPGDARVVLVSYDSQGLDRWWYDFGESVSQIRDFMMTIGTDFDRIDYPQNSISPTSQTRTEDGWNLEWKYGNLFTGASIGIELPNKLNPGPWVSQVTFSAPVSLFLFFFLLFMITTMRGIKVHPINYFFVGAAFFSFHLLLSYLVDHISIHLAFIISAAVSVSLVLSYMRLIVGNRFAFAEVAAAQFAYLILFSYTFFFRGFTGLAITILCVITLFIVMQLTAKVDWESILRNGVRST